MMKRFALALFCAGSPAAALDDAAARELAITLGSLLAAEEFCGLSYNQDVISTFITTNVPPDRMDFAGMLHSHTSLGEFMLSDMTASAKTAHCTSITQTAKYLNFLK